LGPIGCIKSFIHYVHFREETNPIGNDWKSITMDDFDQFSCNLKYVCRFASLSSLPPLDMTYVNDEPHLLDASDAFNEIDVFYVTDDDEASYAIDMSDVLDVTYITDVDISDDLCDISSTSDIPQATATAHHQVDIEYDANGPPVLSSGLTPCPSIPPKKPPYSNQCGNINLHDMSPYESLQAHVHEGEPMVVSGDESTDDLNHDDDDVYDASYEWIPLILILLLITHKFLPQNSHFVYV
jgi:hypothetical protein